MAKCDCPQCGSSNTRRVSLVYQSGISYGTVWTRSGIGSVSARTALARQLAPPAAPGSNWNWMLGRGIAYAFAVHKSAQIGFEYSSKYGMQSGSYDGGPAFAVFLLCLAGSAMAIEFFLYLRFLPFRAGYNKALQTWLQQFLCMRCGYRFIPR